MANLSLEHIYKVYPNGAKAVNDFCLEIADKEFIVFVGPSGCGKSTTLRMIAGLEEISAGELSIDGRNVNYVAPKDRDIAMVFQNYALYPHLTVRENMAFGLKLRRTDKKTIEEKVESAAKMLGLTDYLDRKPGAMSGGQCQRVALGRALVREPKVFLLDEPLSNLDAKLRTSMRSEISKLHDRLQTTFVYVTHDQVEAMTMGDRIVVMKDGYVQQIDTPKNLYRFPANKFVAGFIGTPAMNFFRVHLKGNGENVDMVFDEAPITLTFPLSLAKTIDPMYLRGEKGLFLGLRSEHISADPSRYPYAASCRVNEAEELGTETLIYGDLQIEKENDVFVEDEASATRVVLKAHAETEVKSGEVIGISFDLTHMHLFDAETEATVNPIDPDHSRVEASIENGSLRLGGASLPLPQAISLEDGAYEVVIPLEAVKEGGSCKGVFSGSKTHHGRAIAYLKTEGGMVHVAIADPSVYQEGDEVLFSIDLKRLRFEKDQAVAQEAFDEVNALVGDVYFRKEKVAKTDEKGKTKNVKERVLVYHLLGQKFDCHNPKAVRSLLLSNNRSLFDQDFSFRFSPSDIRIDPNGTVSGTVTGIADYGGEKFAIVDLSGASVRVKLLDDAIPSGEVKLALDIDAMRVHDPEKDIRLC